MKRYRLFQNLTLRKGLSSNITEKYMAFNAMYDGGREINFFLMKLSDRSLRILEPPWGNIANGRIYNTPFVRGSSVFVPNFNEDQGGFWYSSDLGSNWRKVELGGTSAEPIAIKVSEDEKYQMYVDRVHGTYVSINYGSSWAHIGGSEVVDCGISNDGKYMIIADLNEGAYFSDNYGESFRQIFPNACGRADISYLTHRCFLADQSDDVYEYHIDDETTTLIDDSMTSDYGSLSASYNGEIFLTGDSNGNTLLYKDPSTFYPDLSSYLPNRTTYGSQVSYDGKIMKQSDGRETAISFDYGETWENFDPNRF
ncbi:MAG: hypothetical protein ACOC22_00720 [bacterium]